jgi:hypothetical protein
VIPLEMNDDLKKLQRTLRTHLNLLKYEN